MKEKDVVHLFDRTGKYERTYRPICGAAETGIGSLPYALALGRKLYTRIGATRSYQEML